MTENVALVIAPSDDLHALAVQFRFNQMFGPDCRCLLVDTATFPIESSCSWFSNDGIDAVLRTSPALPLLFGIDKLGCGHGSRSIVNLRDVSGVWWRRARNLVVHPDVKVPEFQALVAATMRDVLYSFVCACPVYNKLEAERKADMKPFQLHTATKVGLSIPETLISNDPDEANRFIQRAWNQGKDVVYKKASVFQEIGIPTRLFRKDDLDRLPTLTYCPTTFQERIHGGPDLRIVVVADSVFTAEWRTQSDGTGSVDIRMENGAQMYPSEFPGEHLVKLKRLHQHLDLAIGVYDFKLDANGVPVFFGSQSQRPVA